MTVISHIKDDLNILLKAALITAVICLFLSFFCRPLIGGLIAGEIILLIDMILLKRGISLIFTNPQSGFAIPFFYIIHLLKIFLVAFLGYFFLVKMRLNFFGVLLGVGLGLWPSLTGLRKSYSYGN